MTMTRLPSSVPTTKLAKVGRLLIVGAAGFIGQFVAEASLDAGRPTYVLVRPGLCFPSSKTHTIKSLQDKGAIILHGLINEKESMEKILKENEIDIVISAVGGGNILDQLCLIEAIKSVGTVKRFLPSEFGHDVDRAEPVEPGLSMYKAKQRVRRLVEESDIPYTYICCNSIASWPYYDNTHPSEVLPPLDRFQIYGDGSVKGVCIFDLPPTSTTSMSLHLYGRKRLESLSLESPSLNLTFLLQLQRIVFLGVLWHRSRMIYS
ncbi:hypothetical protein F2P56_033600 [Juglans regia]|uniref:NmrA-like domain-containing protein n=1 Tax=Juglans regia TaxID=51240 RepID=A0A833WTD2_JUGRE|nr:hypothetical protein F2P56_033600 [Juglans regia]